MTAAQTGRYSKYIRPISVLLDLLVVTFFCVLFFDELQLNWWYYIPYQTLAWSATAYFIRFYSVYRFTTPVEIFSKLARQSIIFLLLVIAFFPFAKDSIFSGSAIALFMTVSIFIISIIKLLLFYYLKKYRIMTGSNFRNAIIIGYTAEAIRLKELFDVRNDYGYRFMGYFSDKKSNANIKGRVADIKQYVLNNKVDEIYCSLNEISNEQLKDLVDFADENHKTIKFIPDTKEIFSKNLRVDYYEFFPVLSLQKTMLHEPITKAFKRTFDILFSLFVIFGLLSWLTP